MDRKSHRSPALGLTLIEVMVMLGMLSVLLTLAVPAFQSIQQSLQVRAEALRLFTSLNLARSEAVSRNHPVTLCPSAYAHTGVLRCGGDYRNGWVLLRGESTLGLLPASALLRAWAPMSASLGVHNRAGSQRFADAISFQPDGSAGRNRTLMVCSRVLPHLAPWSVVMNVVGRARLVRGWGDCPVESIA